MKYPLGIQTFSEIRNENYVYIDKTTLIYDLITTGKSYFLSRPRRFGKSLLISTLESVFNGDKALFDGLAIADTDYEFVKHPVILFEFTKVLTRQTSDLERHIINNTNRIAEQYAIELTLDSYEERLEELIRKLYETTGKPVVFLVDEYDKPILDNLFDEQLEAIRKLLAGFYAVVKQSDRFLKFVFITGVSKFAKISVFSSMNSLTDISMERNYATLCGVTQKELEVTFAKPLSELAKFEQIEPTELLAKVKHWYNGYYFHQNAIGIYNPYSLLSLMRKSEFDNYWFETGTPTFLLNLLQSKHYQLENLTEIEVGRQAFKACEPEDMGVQAIFLQTGYLTIKSFEDGLYKLDFPNFEVKKSFFDSVAEHYSKLDAGRMGTQASARSLCSNEVEAGRRQERANMDVFN